MQLRRHAEGVGDGELKASMETFRAREAAMAAELASTGEHSPLAGIAGRPDAAQIQDGPGRDRRQPRTVKVPGTCTREAGLDGALVKDSVGTYRKDG